MVAVAWDALNDITPPSLQVCLGEPWGPLKGSVDIIVNVDICIHTKVKD
jgi:hypothetical protein